MTLTQTNLSTADWRSAQRPTPTPTALRIARLRDYLATNAHMAWTAGYQERAAELARLEEQG